LTTSQATASGFPYDRRFMLLKHADGKDGPQLENMLIGIYPEMALFTQEIRDESETLVVTFNALDDAGKRQIEVPLQPNVDGLAELVVSLSNSSTKAYNLGARYNEWFSSCFGYEVVLAYIGSHHRPVLGNLVPQGQTQSSWMSAVSSRILGRPSADVLTFSDLAAYLVVTEESLADVSSRLPEGESMDVTKFRPNIVLSGCSQAWEEDYWAALDFGGHEIEITASCHRCQSVNVDYATGKFSKDERTEILKKLMKDRRIDRGAKYSPVFGRYGYFPPGTGSSFQIKVGDDVQVTRKHDEHTIFRKWKPPVGVNLDPYRVLMLPEWPGLGTKVS
jgi:uncharacterized protein YcbX